MPQRRKRVQQVKVENVPTENDISLFVAQIESQTPSERANGCDLASLILQNKSVDSDAIMTPSILSKIIALFGDADLSVSLAAIGSIRNAILLDDTKVMPLINDNIVNGLIGLFNVSIFICLLSLELLATSLSRYTC